MRHPSILLVALLLVSRAASGTAFDGTLSFSVDIHSGFGAFVFPGSGSGTSAPTSVQLPAGVFSGTQAGNNITILGLGNAAGDFSGAPLAGKLPVLGIARLHVGGGISPVEVPLAVTAHGAGSLAQVVAGVGVGGSTSATFTVPYSGGAKVFEFAAKFAPFVAETVALDVYTYHVPFGQQASMVTATFSFSQPGAPPSPYRTLLSRMGSDARTPGGLGQITLVSPTRVEVGHAGSSLRWDYLLWTTLTVSFVPEPGTALLLGSGVAGLAHFAQRRRRGRSA